MEQRIIFKQAKKIINILYIYESHYEYRSRISIGDVIESIAGIFFIYDKNGNIINIDDSKKVESKDLLLPIKDRCMQHNDCQQCEIDDIVRAVHSINYAYENHIYNMNMLSHCLLIEFILGHNFKPKVNTDDWMNIN